MNRERARFGDQDPTIRCLHLHTLPRTDQPVRLGCEVRRAIRCAHQQDRARHNNNACGEPLPP